MAARSRSMPFALLDRHVVARFLSNFIMLFALLFVFAISVDVIVQADTFLEAATAAVEEGRASNRVTAVIAIVLDFHGPRVFQFYQYMLGLVSIGAMGFTFAQMHRFRELTAVMAAGVSLRRLAGAVLVAAAGLNVLQALNQELVLPRLAPLLVRDHKDLRHQGSSRFPITLTRDGDRNLLQAAAFDPLTGQIEDLLVIERSETGAATRRITADRAVHDPVRKGWTLEGGRAISALRARKGTGGTDGTGAGGAPGGSAEESGRSGDAGDSAGIDFGDTNFMKPISFIESTLTPQALVVKRFRLYAQMLDLAQVRLLQREGGADDATVTRLTLSRFAGPIANLLVLAVAVPFFLLREPRSLLVQSVKASAITVPAMLSALVFLTVPFEGIPPAASVATPIACLLPFAAWRLAYLRT